MKIQPADRQLADQGSASSFTGTAWQQTLAISAEPEALHVAGVTFEPGARTVWHAHPHGQILIADVGIGRVQIAGGPIIALKPGDGVTIGAGEKHWHGAAPGHLFVHISIQSEGKDAEQATWLEPVSDEEYKQEPDDKSGREKDQ